MKIAQAIEVTKQLMETAQLCYLSTVDSEGYPEVRAMLNLRNREAYPGLIAFFAEQRDPCITYFSTNTASAKVARLRTNRHSCVYFASPETFTGVMLKGNMEIVDDSDMKKLLWQPGWEKYYPKGPLDPDNTILRLHPVALDIYSNMSGGKFILGQDS